MASTFLVLNSSQIYRRGGMADRWFGSLVQHMEENIQFRAPVRSGELAGGIWAERHGAGTEMEGIIHSDAPYTLYVIDGTEGPIMSDGRWDAGGVDPYRFDNDSRAGLFLKLSPGNGHPGGFATQVSGQTGNNFMAAGWAATARQHSSVRGVTPILFR